MNMQSLGYRDLPMRAITKRTKEIVYTTKFEFLINNWMGGNLIYLTINDGLD